MRSSSLRRIIASASLGGRSVPRRVAQNTCPAARSLQISQHVRSLFGNANPPRWRRHVQQTPSKYELSLKPYLDNPNLSNIRLIMNFVKNDQIAAAERIFATLRREGKDDEAVWDAMIRSYLYAGRLKTAEALLKELTDGKSNTLPNGQHFQRFIHYYVHEQQRWMDAYNLLFQMERLGITPSEKSFLILSSSCFFTFNDFPKVIELFEKRIKMIPHLPPSTALLGQVVLARYNMNQHKEALEAYDMMKMIKDVIAEVKAEHGELEDADEIAKRLQNRVRRFDDLDEAPTYRLDEFCSAIAMRAAMYLGNSKKALEIYGDCIDRGLRISEAAFQIVCKVIYRAGGAEVVYRLKSELDPKLAPPPAQLHSVILSVLLGERNTEEAEKYYQNNIAGTPLENSPVVLAQLIELFTISKKYDELERFVNLALSSARTVADKGTYWHAKNVRYLLSKLLNSLSKRGFIDECERIWNYFTGPLAEGGLALPTSSMSLATLLQGFANAGLYDRAFYYANYYINASLKGSYQLEYYFCHTFVSRVLLPQQLMLGRGYRDRLARWLNHTGSIGKTAISQTDMEDFARDFNQWYTIYQNSGGTIYFPPPESRQPRKSWTSPPSAEPAQSPPEQSATNVKSESEPVATEQK